MYDVLMYYSRFYFCKYGLVLHSSYTYLVEGAVPDQEAVPPQPQERGHAQRRVVQGHYRGTAKKLIIGLSYN